MRAILVTLAVTASLAVGIGALRVRHATARLTEAMVAVPPSDPHAPVDFAVLNKLPSPVARYLRHVLRDGQRPIRVARFTQVGELRTDTARERWSSFEASQVVVPPAHAFLWNASVRMAPLIHVRVRDAYFAGQATGRVHLLSAIPIAADSGSSELNAGSLLRYLAEAVWYPTALLPGTGVTWSAIDSTRALATLTDGGSTVALEYRFNAVGEVTGIYAPARWRRVGAKYVQTPWEGRFRRYQEQSGMLVPAEGEVGWYSGGVWQSVWRGTIVTCSYELAS